MLESAIGLIEAWHESGAAGIALLALLFVIASLTFVPRAPLCVAGGLIFGFSAIPVALLGSTAGAVLAFVIARYLLQSRFLQAVEHRPLWGAVLRAVDAEGWRIVGLLRLASPVPGTAANYLLGITRISIWRYTTATFVGLLPQIVLFVYWGATGRAALHATSSPLQLAIMLAGAIVTLLIVVLITRRVKATLAAYSRL
jgi:uncharacterized membrane protein YdjX (TVP38/TMEM64 family)